MAPLCHCRRAVSIQACLHRARASGTRHCEGGKERQASVSSRVVVLGHVPYSVNTHPEALPLVPFRPDFQLLGRGRAQQCQKWLHSATQPQRLRASVTSMTKTVATQRHDLLVKLNVPSSCGAPSQGVGTPGEPRPAGGRARHAPAAPPGRPPPPGSPGRRPQPPFRPSPSRPVEAGGSPENTDTDAGRVSAGRGP